MKNTFQKILLSLILVIGSLTFSGCSDWFKDRGDPIVIDVNTPTGVTIVIPGNQSILEVGDTLQLDANVAPDTAVQTVTWASNNTLAAIVDASGLVTAMGAGRVKITATSTVNTEISGYAYLTVVTPPVVVTGIAISGSDTVHVDETIKLNYALTPIEATATVTWSVNNQAVATIDENGRLTGVSEGTVFVTVLTDNQISDSFIVNVLPRVGTPTEITIIGRSEVEVGQNIRLVISALPLESINSVVWSSSDPMVAAIDENGTIIGLSEGEAVISAVSTMTAAVFTSFKITVIDNSISTDLQQGIIDVIAQTKGSILGVSNYTFDSTAQKYTKYALGSGFVYKAWFVLKDGSVIYELDEIITFDEVDKYCYYLVTNKHVVEGSDAVKIYLWSEDIEVPATLMQYDDKVDLAVVYFEHDRYIEPLAFADSDLLQSGEFAIAIGNPSGYEYSSSATFGIISHPKRYVSDDTDDDGVNDWDAEYIQHDVAINPGNSGGPLLNLQGEVIGINTMKFAATEIDSMGFSIPSNVVSGLVGLLEQGLKPVRARLGVTVIEVLDLLDFPDPLYPIPEGVTYGLYVTEVGAGSVGAAGGILANDIILCFNGVSLYRSLALRAELGKIIVGSGQQIEAEVLRNGETITLTLTF